MCLTPEFPQNLNTYYSDSVNIDWNITLNSVGLIMSTVSLRTS